MPLSGIGDTTIPRNGSNVYFKPAGTAAVPNTTIESAKYNQLLDDIAADLNVARPIVAGGTGGTTVTEAQANLSVDNKIVYTSRALDYTALATDNNAVSIFTAAKTLSLTAAATLGNNWHHTVIATSGAVIIDPNAAELIDGAATITVPSGKAAVVWCTGSAFNATIFDGIPKAVNYTAIATDSGGQIMAIAAITVALTAAATLTSTWKCRIVNASSGSVVIDPNASELINGATTLTLTAGQYTDVTCTGTAFTATSNDPLSGPQLQGYIFGLTLSNNVTDATNDIDIATGSASSDATSPALMALSSSLTKRLDASWAVGTNQGGLDTGSIANSTYHLWLIQRSDTGVTDALFSLSATSPTMPSNYDRKRRIGSIIRKSATILAFIQIKNVFTLSVPQNDYSGTNPGTSAVLATLTTPSGIKARAQIWFFLQTSTATRRSAIVTSLDQVDTAPVAGTGSTIVTGASTSVGAAQSELMVRTNTSSQIRFRFDGSDANLSVFINTTGWIDDQL